MSRTRITATELARLFSSVSEPVYVLDDEYTLVFVNQACRLWLGPMAEGLVGCRVTYHSEPAQSPVDALAAQLCPPPQCMAGHEMVAPVLVTLEDGRQSCRQSRFVPLGISDESTFAVMAILETQECDPAAHKVSPVREEDDALALHQRIARFRREALGRYRIDRLLGQSSAIRLARRRAEVAVANRTSVLLVGPPGSGRRHIAAAIHYGAGSEMSSSLIPLDCSVLGIELINSTIAALAGGEVLGEQTIYSTLLLNEVDQLPAEWQAELVGPLIARRFPLRLMATAQQSLTDLAQRGQFREDLATALSTVMIELPSLAERLEDLPVLAQLFLEQVNVSGERQLSGFTPEVLDALHGYDWPGNVAELEQVVSDTHQKAGGPLIDRGDLPERIHLTARAAVHPGRVEEAIVLDEFLGRVERELIRRALMQAKGNKAKAARLLGLTRPRLYRRLEQLGLEEP